MKSLLILLVALISGCASLAGKDAEPVKITAPNGAFYAPLFAPDECAKLPSCVCSLPVEKQPAFIENPFTKELIPNECAEYLEAKK